jgi:hypothetical protein
MSDWIEEFRNRIETEERIKLKYKEKLKSLLQEAKNELGSDYRIGVLPNLIADMFELAEHNGDGEQNEFDNQAMSWGLDYYVTRKVKKVIPRFKALYNYCVDKGFNLENTFGYNAGDREVSFIPCVGKQVLYFTNQNIKFVCVLSAGQFHIRQVYDDLFAPENADNGFYDLGQYDSVDCLRDGLKKDNGLEIAVTNLLSKYSRWSDCVEGNEYPGRINLKNMIKCNFDNKSRAFTYGDIRDEGYILSNGGIGRCEVGDYHTAKYVFSDLVSACDEVPKGYLTAILRDEKLDSLLDLI